jgi:hypothetical protein
VSNEVVDCFLAFGAAVTPYQANALIQLQFETSEWISNETQKVRNLLIS